MKASKVTVLMSVYNGEKYLHEAIDSILNQTFKDFEFIIINDCSTDDTAKILESYKDSRIRIVTNEKNIGVAKSLNKGLQLAQGRYIARMDADDISALNRLQKEVDFLHAHEDCAVVGTFTTIIDENSQPLLRYERPIEDADIQKSLWKENCLAHGSVMMRKQALDDIGIYDESIKRAQDYDLWLRLSEKYHLANIPEYLYSVRHHDKSISAQYREEQLKYVEHARKKAQERLVTDILLKVKEDAFDIKKAKMLMINHIVDHIMMRKHTDPNNKISVRIKRSFLTLFYKFSAHFRFSKKIKIILTKFQIKDNSLEQAKTDLMNILNE